MRKLKLKYASAKNFLCFGADGIELKFSEYGNIVVVKGQNLDVENEDKVASNGVGKSSLPEIPVYALFGKTIKKPKKLGHADIINNKSGKALHVELCWDDYRVVRTRKPDGLRLWKSADGVWDKTTEITLGGMPATQKYIEELIGLNYETFVNIFIFTDDYTNCFLECDTPTKREIVENLLSLEKYRGYSDSAKLLAKKAKDNVKLLANDYQHLLTDLNAARTRITKIEQQEKEWKESKEKDLRKLLENLKAKRDQLDKSDTGAALAKYRDAQERIEELNTLLPQLETKKVGVAKVLEDVAPKIVTLNTNHEKATEKYNEAHKVVEDCRKLISENEKIIKEAAKKIGKDCPYCLSKITKDNFENIISQAQVVVDEHSAKLPQFVEDLETANTELQTITTSKTKVEKGVTQKKQELDKISSDITKIHSEISDLSKIKEPAADVEELLIQEQIEELKKQVEAKKEEINGPSPFQTIKQSLVQEVVDMTDSVKDKKKELDEAESQMPYFDFWIKAFGDNGIRKYVIEGIVPALNSRISYWLQFLIDNKIKLVFDSNFNETIDRFPFQGRPYVYHGMSGGQRRRLNLSVGQSFAHIRELNSGASPSVVFLDEVSMNMDEIGVEGIYRMICELAKDKQVFVIDHNESLLQMLDGCDKVQLQMKDEVTTKCD